MRVRIPTRRTLAGERQGHETDFAIRGCVAALWATSTQAAAPDRSLYPVARPGAADEPAGIVAISSRAATPLTIPNLRPETRPESPQLIAAAARPADLPLLGPDTSLMPYLRPKSLEQEVLFKKRKLPQRVGLR